MQYTDDELEKYLALLASIVDNDEGGITRFRSGLAPRWRYSAEDVARALNETYDDRHFTEFGAVFANRRWSDGEVILHSPVSLAAHLNRPGLIRRLCDSKLFDANSSLGCIFHEDMENDGYETVDEESPLTVAIDARSFEAVACLLDLGARAEPAWARLIEADADTTNELLESLLQDRIRTGLQDPTVIDRFAAGLQRARQT